MVPAVRMEGCGSLELAAVERLLAIEWRDASLAAVEGGSTIELVCRERSVSIRFRLDEHSEFRVRAIEVGEGEWAVAPRIIALVSAQLAVSEAREREDARRAAVEASEREARAREERSRRASAASPRPIEPPPSERYVVDLSAGLRVRQWDAPWWSAGGAISFALRAGRTPVWIGAWADVDGAVRRESLGEVSFVRAAVGPTLTLASDRDAVVSAHVRVAALLGAQSLWARAAQSNVDEGTLVSSSVEARVRAGISGRISRSLSLSFDVDAAIECVSLDGAVGASRELRTGGAVLGAALSLSWRGR
jgi:hypothetical protein